MASRGSRSRSGRARARRDSRERRRPDSSRRKGARDSRSRRRSSRRRRSGRSGSRGRGEARNALTYGRRRDDGRRDDGRRDDGRHDRRDGGAAEPRPPRLVSRAVAHLQGRRPASPASASSGLCGASAQESEEEEEESSSYDGYETETCSEEDGDAALAKSIQKAKDAKQKQRAKDDIVHFDWQVGMDLNSRYKVSRLLGDGTFGRVLLAEDTKDKERRPQKVAIKVIRNVDKYIRNAKREADILEDIRNAGSKAHGCVQMFSTFWHKTSSGELYYCLAFEVLGASLYDLLKGNRFRGMWVQDIQSVAQQSLEALSFLHDQLQLTHTDLKLENILFQTRDAHIPAEFMRMEQYLEAHPSQRGRTMAQYLRPASTRIKLIDFGNATYELEHHSSVINTRQYRAPEVILAMGWNERSDLWSVGCIIMELYTGELLFRTHESFEHLALMEKSLERFPSPMLLSASDIRRKQFLSEDGKGPRLHWPQGASSETSARHVRSQRRLHEMVLERHRPVADFVASLLTLEPKRRPSASAALAHPFLFERLND